MTIFKEGLTFNNPERIKPSFLLPFVFVLEDTLRRIEILDDTNLVDDSFGFDTSSFT